MAASKPVFKIHLGAHKTGTTHFQQTLDSMEGILNGSRINYEPIGDTRKKIGKVRRYVQHNPMFKILPQNLKSRSVANRLIANDTESRVFLRSEENILGRVEDACSIDLYPNCQSRVRFVKYLSNYFSLELYLSIRNLANVLSGAYITSLRFDPAKAIEAKRNLIKQLDSGYKVSWIPVIDRLYSSTGECLNIWTQEYYQNNSKKIIGHFSGINSDLVPSIKPPSETMTPSHKAIEKVEALAKNINKSNKDWTRICDSIYKEFAASEKVEKYSFLSNAHKILLTESYEKDKEYFTNVKNDGRINFLDII